MSAFHLSSFDSDDDDSDYIPSDSDEVNNQEFITLPDTKVIENVAETFAQPSTVEEKDRVNTLWKQFLDEGSDASQQTVENTDTKTSVKRDSHVHISKSETPYDDVPCKPSTSIQTLRTSISEDENLKSEISRKENKVTINSLDSSAKKRGLNSLLGKIQNKKPKITTLQKSLNDWESFKKDEGIGSDLEIFNRGKSGYLERQAFLMRSDLRSFEIEKSIRLAKK